MSKIESGLQSALVAERQKRQQLEAEKALILPVFQKNIWEVVKKDFPTPNKKVQELANNAYFIDGRQPNALTAIAWDNYPDKSFDDLVKELKSVDLQIAKEIQEKGIDFKIDKDGDCDLEGWQENLPANGPTRTMLGSDDEELYEKVWNCLSDFASNISKEIQSYLEKEGIEDEDELEHYILQDDLYNKPVFIKEITNGGDIFTTGGWLGWRSDDETEWEFIHKNRGMGCLIGLSQIVNPEMLPDFLQGETIFVVQ